MFFACGWIPLSAAMLILRSAAIGGISPEFSDHSALMALFRRSAIRGGRTWTRMTLFGAGRSELRLPLKDESALFVLSASLGAGSLSAHRAALCRYVLRFGGYSSVRPPVTASS